MEVKNGSTFPAGRMKGVSIVMCSYNGVERLQKSLDYIVAQKFDPSIAVELVFVDNRSTDGTYSFVQQYFKSRPHPYQLQIIQENRPGKAYAVESGYDKATLSYLITCDDDNWLEEHYVQRTFDIMEKYPSIGMLGGKSIGAFETHEPEWLAAYASSYAIGAQGDRSGFFNGNRIWGAGMVVRRSIWEGLRKQGFEFITGKDVSKAVGEDIELSWVIHYLGYKFYYDESLILHHWMPQSRITWSKCLQMFNGFGRTYVYFAFYRELLNRGGARVDFESFKYKLVMRYLGVVMSSILKSYGGVLFPRGYGEGKKLSLKYEEAMGFLTCLRSDKTLASRIEALTALINRMESLKVSI